VDRLNEIVSRLLYFARGDPTAHRPLAVNPVVAEALDLLEAQAAGQAVKIVRDLAPDLPDVRGNAGALRQVFLNLATNALQAMPQGGELRCQTRATPARDAVEVCFTDTGSGIAEEDRKHLFEPFFTTRPEGTGLGLAICREIVTQHGGQIAVEYPPGRGVTVRLTLPAGGRR
jgi:signal transduction histidine kinase